MEEAHCKAEEDTLEEMNENEQPANNCETSSSAHLPTTLLSSTPVQVVKPTPRVEEMTACTSEETDVKNDEINMAPLKSDSINIEHPEVTVPAVVDSSCTLKEQEKDPMASLDCSFEEESEFDWNDYLEATGSIAAPPTLFPHVENSLQTLYTKEMKIEVPNKFIKDAYWVANIITPCGPLLRLRYEGYDANDMSDDFWYETVNGDIRPIGYCEANNLKLEPPPIVLKKWGDSWMEKLKLCLEGTITIPPYLFESNGCTTIDQIKEGMKFEVQDDMNLTHVWIATVIKNVGGRLLLRYDGVTNDSHDFWLFYLSFRVHPFGWARGNECTYKPPTVLLAFKSVQEWANILNDSMSVACKRSVPAVIFAKQEVVVPHEFKEGMHLEALDPTSRLRICAATVTKVLSRFYFIVELDQSFVNDNNDVRPASRAVCCHSATPTIFPPGWAKSNLLQVEFFDKGLSCEEEFVWNDYLARLNKSNPSVDNRLAPKEIFKHLKMYKNENDSFQIGMKFEAVNLFQPKEICVATVCKTSGNLIWIQMDNSIRLLPNQVVAHNSFEIFPVGWCDSNAYKLKVPVSQHSFHKQAPKKVAIVIPNQQENRSTEETFQVGPNIDYLKSNNENIGKAWCPVIYFNHKCFTGPFLSITRIAGLPKQVGPGPIHLVLKEVISMIVGVSYLPSRCLSVLQSDEDEQEPGMQQQLIKAKYKGRKYKAMVDIVSKSDKVIEYCRNVCKKLQCCTNLFGPQCFTDNCPESCYSLTKSNPNQTVKRKKRRKKKSLLVKNEDTPTKVTNVGDEAVTNNEEDKLTSDSNNNKGDEKANPDCDEEEEDELEETEEPKEKRKCIDRTAPRLEIVTRGASLPNFISASGKRKNHENNSFNDDINKAFYMTKDSNTVLDQMDSTDDEQSVKHTYMRLDSNPLQWSVEQVSNFIRNTDCYQMTRLLKEQEIDGQALLLLTLPTIQEHLELKLGPAIKLSNHIEQLKSAFYCQYGN